MIEKVIHEERELAVIIRNDYYETGIHFLTRDDYSQQLAYMSHPKGKIIDAHIHNHIERKVCYTQEVLVIKKGILRVDFYENDQSYLQSIVLYEGDIILLASGGHGFKVLEDVEMIEIKQGPYLGEKDKIRFEGVAEEFIKVKEGKKI